MGGSDSSLPARRG